MTSRAFSKRNLTFSIFVIVSLVIIFTLTYVSPTIESAKLNNEASKLENYDIRLDKSAEQNIQAFLFDAGTTNSSISDLRKSTKQAEINLKNKFSDLNVEFNEDLRIPEVIGRKISKTNFLTAPNGKNRVSILRAFLAENQQLFGLNNSEIYALKTTADYTNPNGILSFVSFEQRFNNIPVFRGEVKAGFTKNNQIIRIINNLAPHIGLEHLSTNFGSPKNAVVNAARHINTNLNNSSIKKIETDSPAQKTTFESETFTDKITSEKIYFPISNGVVRSAWRVLFWTKDAAYYVIADVETGTLLWRKNITEYQTEIANYNVYGNQTSSMKTADSPSPFTPGCTDPNNCPQPPAIPRTDFTLIGNEPPYDFNNLGWIPDGENRTIGNNVEAGIDRDSTQGIDPNGWAVSGPNRIFNYSYNPAPGIPSPGEEPVPMTQTYPPSEFQQGSITQAFYTVNRWHDETYLLGFTEATFNFQDNNFGRGGSENDSISVEIQDGSGTNGASFSTPADGGRPRAQFFVFTGSDPDRDGALDNQIVVHELTHGLSNRLHGNTAGLGSNMSRGMGEGSSDFFALALLSEPTDDQCGNYPVGSYSIESYYYGIRRFPTSKIECTGPNGNPHNPLTFGDLNQGCDISDGAYPPEPIGSSTCDQVHNAGEIWSQALWEVRGLLIEKHGAAEGNRRVMQYVIDGMKLAPLNPTFIQERDAILAATGASDPNDLDIVREGFAIRGMGYSAEVISESPAVVVESFDYLPNVFLQNPLNFIEISGNQDGFPDRNETLQFSVILANNTGNTVTNVSANINGGKDVSFFDIPDDAVVKALINYTIPLDVECGSLHEINVNITSDVGSKTETRTIRIGIPDDPATFQNTTTINVPQDTSSGAGPANPYPSTINVSGLSGTQTIKVELTDVAHTWTGDIDIMLESPSGETMIIMSDNFSSSNRKGTISTTLTLTDEATENMPNTGVPPVTGTFKPTNNTADDPFDNPAPNMATHNPAPAGNATFVTAFGTNSQLFNGEWKLWIDDDAGSDSGTIGGWKISFESYICLPCLTLCTLANGVRADFDGDGRSDLSVYRPNEGNWYLNQSVDGFSVLNWGIASDELVPADYDGDFKTDFAVFRANADSSQADFYILNSSDFTFNGYSWGLPGDIPVINDFDGDRKADISIYRPTENTFYILNSFGGVFISEPMPNGTPLSGDFDGDGQGDLATYNNGLWSITESVNGKQTSYSFGLSSDKLVPDDYDGDGRTDMAVYRPSNSTWYIQKSSGGVDFIQFGISTDIPVPGDYDGDGKTDVAVYRNGVWYLNQSAFGVLITQFGLDTDKPIPTQYLPK